MMACACRSLKSKMRAIDVGRETQAALHRRQQRCQSFRVARQAGARFLRSLRGADQLDDQIQVIERLLEAEQDDARVREPCATGSRCGGGRHRCGDR